MPLPMMPTLEASDRAMYLVATPLADRARIPTINWAGTERARSEFMFHLQVGSHEDEPVLLALAAILAVATLLVSRLPAAAR